MIHGLGIVSESAMFKVVFASVCFAQSSQLLFPVGDEYYVGSRERKREK